jgi:hypothetical protein
MVELHGRGEAQKLSRFGRVGDAVANISGPEQTRILRLHLDVEAVGEKASDLGDRDRPPGSHVDRLPDRSLRLQRQKNCIDDVAAMDEIPRLSPVLEDHRRPTVQQAGGKDRSDARVRVRQGLPGPVDVEEAQRDGGNPVRGTRDQAELLVIAFRDRVDGRRYERFGFRRRNGPKLCAARRAKELPAAGGQLRVRPGGGSLRAMIFTRVRTFTVDRHRGGHDEPPWAIVSPNKPLQEQRGGHRVCLDIAGDLIHRLTDPDSRGEMNDTVHPFERLVDDRAVAHAPAQEPNAFEWRVRDRVVDLLLETVEHDDVVPRSDQPLDEMGADEPCPSGHENTHGQDIPATRRVSTTQTARASAGARGTGYHALGMGVRVMSLLCAVALALLVGFLPANRGSSSIVAPLATVALSPTGDDATCARATARACRTFQRSYELAQPGDVISVQAGTYPVTDSTRDSVTIFGPERSSSSPITFSCAGGIVTHSSRFFTIKAFHVKLSGSCFKLHGLMVGEGGDRVLTTRDVTVEGAHLDGLEVTGARDVTLRNIEIGPNVYCYAQGRTGTGFNGGPITPEMWCDPAGPPWEAFYASTGSDRMQLQTFFHSNSGGVTPTVLLEGSYVHDFQTKDVYNLHTGCGLVWTRPGEPAGSIVFRGNRFENCAVQGIQFTQADGITVTGNWFGHPTEPLSNGLGDDVEAGREQREVSLRTESGWSPANYLISFNSFDHGISLDNTQLRPSYSNVVVRRNLLGQNSYCPEGIVFESNVFAGRACGPDQLTVPFGYILKDERLVVVKKEAKTITEIFKAAVAEKEPAAIAKELRKARKGRWSAHSVRKIVENDFYLGSKVGPKGAHLAIVSRATWKRAQRGIRR